MDNDLPVDEGAIDQAEMAEILSQTSEATNAELAKQFNPWGGQLLSKQGNQPTPDDGGAPAVETPASDPADTDAGDDEEEPTREERLASLAEEYGYSAEDLEGYETVEDARQMLVTLDSQTRQLGRDALLYGQQSPPAQSAADDQSQPALLQPQFPTQPTPPVTPDNADLEAAIREYGSDSPLVGVLRRQQQQIAQQQQQLTAWQQQQQKHFEQQQAAEQQRALYETVEQLQEIDPQRYGSKGKFNRVQEKFLTMAVNEIRVLTAGLQQVGAQIPTRKQLAKRVDDGLFFQLNEKQQRLAAAKAGVSRNSARLGQPSAAKRKDATVEKPEDWEGPDEENPYLLNYYQQLQNG